ncbi:sphingosine-1-phosphate transporter MFSD2B isoform X1 [Podarcis raffonei]|uniref:sphingosine-1-phosphate transporter MFSD2B isoform X1 n=2 Tax=Podarcis raffonei TaxID=65483 RepID=UPI0023292368|nr:sphingosine-1-phosphate transporter MFSD2B isoform X1 [Podarcis raffonei]
MAVARMSGALLPEPRLEGACDEQLSNEDKLSVCSKLCYGIGGAPNQAASSATSFFLQIFLLDIAMITPFHTSLMLFIGKTWGAAADPVAGYLISKSKRTKIGLLMPWLLGTTPFLIVSYFFLWYCPSVIKAKDVWYMAFFCLFQALSTLFHVPYTALVMFLSADQKERDSATAYRMGFEGLGTLVGATLQVSMVSNAHSSDHCNDSVDNMDSPTDLYGNSSRVPDMSEANKKLYMIAGGTISVLYLIGIIALCAGVKEKVDPYALKSDQQIPFLKGHKLALMCGPYVKLAASFLLISTAVQVVQNNFVLFCSAATNLHNHIDYLVMIVLISAALSVPCWQWFLNKFGKKTTAGGISLMIPASTMLVFFPEPAVAYLSAGVSGISIAASLLLPWSMLPDVVDYFRVQNPNSVGHETIFYASYTFFHKMSAGIGLGISAASLNLAGFKSGVCKQSHSVVIMLKVLVGAVPSILVPLGLFILIFYPINEETRKETKHALERRRRRSSILCKNEEITPL